MDWAPHESCPRSIGPWEEQVFQMKADPESDADLGLDPCQPRGCGHIAYLSVNNYGNCEDEMCPWRLKRCRSPPLPEMGKRWEEVESGGR